MSRDMDKIDFYCQVTVNDMVSDVTQFSTTRSNWQLRGPEIIKVLATSIAEQTTALLEEENS
jgi:hypothetical protein